MKSPRIVFAALSVTLAWGCTDGSLPVAEPGLAANSAQPLGEPPPADVGVAYHTATLLGDGTVLVAGGLGNDDNIARADAFLYVSAETGLKALPAMNQARYAHTATRLHDGTVLIAGGFDPADAALSSAELYDPERASFSATRGTMQARRGAATATLLGDGRVLLAGGFESGARGTKSMGLELYDPSSQKFTPVAGGSSHGGSNVAVTLADGRVALFWLDGRAQQVFIATNDSVAKPNPPFLDRLSIPAVTAATRMPDDSIVVFDGARLHHVDPELACDFGEALCGDECTPIDTVENCGACGVTCKTNAACVDGQCTCEGASECEGGCYDFNWDSEHCGSCDTDCTSLGGYCYDGTCSGGCTGNRTSTLCNKTCVNLDTDPENCGSCGHRCGEGYAWSCTDGTCTCAGVMCGSVCTDLATDGTNCGDCSTACGDEEWCNAGQCAPPYCYAPQTYCGHGCVFLSEDPQNCGECGRQCVAGQRCFEGTCTGCPPLTTACNGQCADTYRDPQNCGGCGTVCSGGECSFGVCTECPANRAWCYGTCVSLDDNANCGGCEQVCPEGYQCEDRTCVLTVAEPGALPSTSLTLANDQLLTTELDLPLSFTDSELSCWPPCGYGGYPGPDPAPAALFGAEGHTTTALPDGSLLAIGGKTASSVWRLRTPWNVASRGYPGGTGAAVTLPNGNLLIAANDVVTQGMGEHVTLVTGLPVPWSPLGAALDPSGSVLLVNRDVSVPAVLYDASDGSYGNVELDWRWPSTRVGRSLPLRDGSLLVAGSDGVEIVRPPKNGVARVDPIALDLGCDRPALVRLTNGRILVVGSDGLYEVDTSAKTASEKVETRLGRCRAAVIARHDGTVLVWGGNDPVSGADSEGAEQYDPVRRVTRRWSLSDDLPPAERVATSWFDTPMLGGPYDGAWLSYQEDAVLTGGVAGNVHLDATGALVPIDIVPSEFGSGEGEPLVFPTAPTLEMGAAIDVNATFSGASYPLHAPEGSSGTTQSSATNLPVPVWFPAEGGWPSLGTLTGDLPHLTYHVPKTPFPGLGLLFVAVNGKLYPLGPATIAGAAQGATCNGSGECDSGYCIDGVCCDELCGGACEACSRAEKGRGKDGVCEPVVAGRVDDACDDALASCGENGKCDGEGHCALYPDGAPCARGAECSNGYCIAHAPTTPSGEAGSTGSDGASGTTGTDAQPTCNSEQQVVSPEGTLGPDCSPYRCRQGACVLRCASTRDCASNYACNADGRCVTPVGNSKSSGCGCRTTSDAASRDWSALGALAIAASLARRRRARSATGADGAPR